MMATITIIPNLLSGNIHIPPSKSLSHRAVICAALANGTSCIKGLIFSDDITATIDAMKALGTEISQEKDSVLIRSNGSLTPQKDIIDCCESGSTLRFLIPLALTNHSITFTGRGKLIERPLDTYYKIFDEQQIAYQTTQGNLPLSVTGQLKPGYFRLRGDISSQFITGLLFTLPRLESNSKINLTTPLESQGYIDLTLTMLERFGIHVTNNDYQEFIIPGNQRYTSQNYHVEGDYSQAAFWLAAGLIGSSVCCLDLNPHSVQGDKVIIDILNKLGGNITFGTNSITATPSKTSGIEINAAQCPDLVPILAVLAAVSEGTTHIVQAGRLRLKESDRLHAITQELNKLGADIHEGSDFLTIQGRKELTGGIVDSWNDHRIAMALAIASLRCHESVTIQNSSCVNKSYPDFWKDFAELGGKIK
ncbi:3-phosphoshikimate 1-carboxyvinyltransferase [Sporomusaceae bacterium BoRhaA]|uniref:3-phosphoshikimate 1-carboxyvinyltransferase n=1 Tax=Pelorhabdus rhamnosifermentans TaxID=2772457 RepID=UPI001C06004A|nr:3-phosphoshikimate 1-carboxyvinyltransferase [Pelorhabdus rhamnosifermentans]MBU2700862.1 3-phosphoshikimate 1-carboxyvinyltransferase [Pelorhabdus rhamnosifermentans]